MLRNFFINTLKNFKIVTKTAGKSVLWKIQPLFEKPLWDYMTAINFLDFWQLVGLLDLKLQCYVFERPNKVVERVTKVDVGEYLEFI